MAPSRSLDVSRATAVRYTVGAVALRRILVLDDEVRVPPQFLDAGREPQVPLVRTGSIAAVLIRQRIPERKVQARHQRVPRATMRLRRVPMREEHTSIVSPTFKKRSVGVLPSALGRVVSIAVPAPVPPAMMSPGWNVKSRDRYSMNSAKLNVMSREL